MSDTLVTAIIEAPDTYTLQVSEEPIVNVTVEEAAAITVTVSQGATTPAIDKFDVNFEVQGVTQGIYSDGDIITAGTYLLDVIKNMLINITYPTYTAPTFSISGTGSFAVEHGTLISPTLTPTFNQNDAGDINAYVITGNSIEVASGVIPSPVTIPEFQLTAAIAYTGSASYDAGPVKQDSLGNDYLVGWIDAGSVNANTITYQPYRRYWYAEDTGVAAPSTSAQVRSLESSGLNPSAGTSFNIAVQAGCTRVCIAYPSSIRDILSINDPVFGETKDVFTQTLVEVEGANGSSPIEYKVYTYLPSVPYGDAVTYQVTL